MFRVQRSTSVVAVLQGQGRALQLLPQPRRLPLPLPPLLLLVVQLRLAALLLLLQPRRLQHGLVSQPRQRAGLQGGLAELSLQLQLTAARGLQTATLSLQLRPESVNGEL